MILYFKSLHIIFVVTWFAGLFYIVRFFVYQTEALNKEEPEKSIIISNIKLWSSRLWFGITWPSAILCTIFGLAIMHPWFGQTWFNAKMGFAIGLWIYQLFIHVRLKELHKDIYKHSGQTWRVMNEVATVFLFAMVFLVILKDMMNMIWASVSLIAFMVVLFVAIKIYKIWRQD